MLKNGSVKLSRKVKSQSLDETKAIACDLASRLAPGDVVAFFGDLGSGKTTFIRTLASKLCQIPKEHINSPTFQYLNIYNGDKTVYHFDLYRLKDSNDFVSAGFDEMLEAGGISCIEWAERILDILPERTICVTITHVSETERVIEVKSKA